jgi:hypothetical protein
VGSERRLGNILVKSCLYTPFRPNPFCLLYARSIPHVSGDRGCSGRRAGPEVGAPAAGPTDQCDARYCEMGKDSRARYGDSRELKKTNGSGFGVWCGLSIYRITVLEVQGLLYRLLYKKLWMMMSFGRNRPCYKVKAVFKSGLTIRFTHPLTSHPIAKR